MKSPVPDWALYAGAVAALVIGSMWLASHGDPPSDTALDETRTIEALLGPVTPFAPDAVMAAPGEPSRLVAGTAFSISREGRWVTARHVVEGCRRPALLVGDGRAVSAAVRLAPHADVALLITDGGPEPLPIAPISNLAHLAPGQRAYHPGYPQGGPGEVASRLLGEERPGRHGRIHPGEPVLAWAEAGRTNGLSGTLAGLSGAPALDAEGRVMGVTIAEAPRRGRIYTTTPRDFARAIAGQYDDTPPRHDLSIADYSRAADRLRRTLSVAQVACLG